MLRGTAPEARSNQRKPDSLHPWTKGLYQSPNSKTFLVFPMTFQTFRGRNPTNIPKRAAVQRGRVGALHPLTDLASQASALPSLLLVWADIHFRGMESHMVPSWHLEQVQNMVKSIHILILKTMKTQADHQQIQKPLASPISLPQVRQLFLKLKV